MNAYITWSVVGLLVISVVAYIGRRSAVDRQKERAYLLSEIKSKTIKLLIEHVHKHPADRFRWIEEICQNKKFTREELGLSLNALLGHAVINQKEAIGWAEQELSQALSQLDELRYSDPRLSIEVWEREIKHQLKKIDTYRSALVEARAAYASINERWIVERGTDPKAIDTTITSLCP